MQTQRILTYLKEHGSITTWQSFRLFGDTRLSDKIFRLKKLGYKFSEKWITKKNRYGEPVRFKKYIFEGVKENENI